MTVDQATRLRYLVETSRSRARVVAVTSGKGGVGKSSIALNVAIAVAKMNARVVLVDADFGLANLDVMCGVSPSAGLADVVSGRRRLSEAVTRTPYSIQLIAGANGIAYLADMPDEDRTRLLAQLGAIERESDLIVVDTGAGVSRNVVKIAAAADDCLVVTTPEPTSITDAYAAVKLISREREHGTLSLVVNQAATREEAAGVAARISAVARRFLGVEIAHMGYVLRDPAVARCVCMRKPLMAAFPASSAALCMKAIAARLQPGRAARASGEAGFFSRLRTFIGR